ncbi:MAG: RNA-binding S4 domain-containing protein [Chitinophagales bacterium]
MTTFELKPNQEYIEMNKLLKFLGIVGTGGEANMRIMDGEAWVNGVEDTRKRRKLRKGDKVEFDGQVIEIQ